MLVTLDPVIVDLGPIAVRWFGLLALAGLGLAVWRTLRALDRDRLPRTAALDALAWALPAGLIAARVVHLLGWWDYYFTHPAELWQVGLDGLSLWGGLLGGAAMGFARLRSRRNPAWRRRMLDAGAPNLALGIALGRLGEFLDGQGQGVPSDLPWSTQYASRLAATPDFGVSRQPAQLYDGLVALALWIVLSALPRRWPAGTRVALFCLLYSSARLVLGGVRLDPAFLFGLQLEQILAIGGLAFGLWWGLHLVRVPGRLRQAARAPLTATLYATPGCHLCETAIRELEALGALFPHRLEVIDIRSHEELVRQYWDRVPVLKIGDREYNPPLRPEVLEQALVQAGADEALRAPKWAAAPASPTKVTAGPGSAAHGG